MSGEPTVLHDGPNVRVEQYVTNAAIDIAAWDGEAWVHYPYIIAESASEAVWWVLGLAEECRDEPLPQETLREMHEVYERFDALLSDDEVTA